MESKSELKRKATLDPLWAAQRIAKLEVQAEVYLESVKEVEIENARLREALEKIAEDKCSTSSSLIVRISAMEDVARSALAQLRDSPDPAPIIVDLPITSLRKKK